MLLFSAKGSAREKRGGRKREKRSAHKLQVLEKVSLKLLNTLSSEVRSFKVSSGFPRDHLPSVFCFSFWQVHSEGRYAALFKIREAAR